MDRWWMYPGRLRPRPRVDLDHSAHDRCCERLMPVCVLAALNRSSSRAVDLLDAPDCRGCGQNPRLERFTRHCQTFARHIPPASASKLVDCPESSLTVLQLRICRVTRALSSWLFGDDTGGTFSIHVLCIVPQLYGAMP
ncbi:hypothetical protein FKP32DRAFT_1185997 [Trametes sanguinea]|nr:hypothetical protein FKP32DRAFT_1185997 [Trametes sanguinea]